MAEIDGVILHNAKSICWCGHIGDGLASQHAGAVGHGACKEPGCKCRKFTWRSFLPHYTDWLELEQRNRARVLKLKEASSQSNE